jgi:hypothetical protein
MQAFPLPYCSDAQLKRSFPGRPNPAIEGRYNPAPKSALSNQHPYSGSHLMGMYTDLQMKFTDSRANAPFCLTFRFNAIYSSSYTLQSNASILLPDYPLCHCILRHQNRSL